MLELPWLLHPTQMKILDSVHAGCVIGNLIVFAAWYAAVALGTMVLSFVYKSKGRIDAWDAASVRLRFPSCGSLAPLFFLAGSFDSAFELLTGGESNLDARHYAIGVAGMVYSCAILFYLWAGCWKSRFHSYIRTVNFDPSANTRAVRYVFGNEIWTSLRYNHSEREGVIFENYSENKKYWVTQQGRYALVEVGQIPILIAVAIIHVDTWVGCAGKAFGLCVIYALLAASVIIQRPFIPPMLHHVSIVMNVCPALGMLLYGIIFASQQAMAPAAFVANLMFFVGLIFNLIRNLYDVMTYAFDLADYNVKLMYEESDKTLVDMEGGESDVTMMPLGATDIMSMTSEGDTSFTNRDGFTSTPYLPPLIGSSSASEDVPSLLHSPSGGVGRGSFLHSSSHVSSPLSASRLLGVKSATRGARRYSQH